MTTSIHTAARLLSALYGAKWALHRLLALLMVSLPASPPAQVTWVGVPLGGGTARVEHARRLAESHPGARLLLAGTAVEVSAARRWLDGAAIPIEAYVVEPGTTYACAVALRRGAGDAPGLLATDGSHLTRTRLSWALAGGLLIPPGASTSPSALRPEEMLKFLAYLLRH